VIYPALPEWASVLTDLAMRSKASWGYDNDFMARASSELRITEEDIRARPVYVWLEEDRPLAFYALLPDPPEVELDLFFVEPEAQRRGIGRQLFKHAVAEAARNGWTVMVIQSDPYAEPFYLSCGAIRAGESRSPSTGRMLPLLRYPLPPILTDPDVLATYLDEIGTFKPLSEAELRTLAEQIEAGRKAAQQLADEDIERPGHLRLKTTQRQADNAKKRIIEANLHLVASIARRYRATGIPLADLIQEGNIGLIRAVDNYDSSKGFKFETYATWWIQQAIQRALGEPPFTE
jgi:GNAT superfamily N-acetyltransferase